jgi:hypothetical protein
MKEPEKLVLKGVRIVVTQETQGFLQWVTTQTVDLELTTAHLQQLKEYLK